MNTHFFDEDNNALRWQEAFTEGVPLIYLHGLGCASSSDYAPVITSAGYGGVRSWLVDLPGFGYSDRPRAHLYHSSRLATLLKAWIDATGSPRVNLFGHSAGAFIALKLAAMMSDRVAHLILCEPGLSDYGVSFLQGITAVSEADFIDSGFEQLLETLKAEGNDAWRGPLQVSAPQAVHQWARSALADHANDWMMQLGAQPINKGVIVSETTPAERQTLFQQAGCQVVPVPDSGHMMAYDNPNGLARAIVQLLA